MWRPAVVVEAPAAEPLSLSQAKAQLRVTSSHEDTLIAEAIATARAVVEAITGTRLVTHTVRLKASAWSDLDALPIAPVQTVEVSYLDPTGTEQVVDEAAYRADLEGLEPRLVALSPWPATEPGSLITVEAVVGYGTAEEQDPTIVATLKMIVTQLHQHRAGVTDELRAMVADMLVNHRLHLVG